MAEDGDPDDPTAIIGDNGAAVTPLLVAATHDQLQNFRRLLAAGADPSLAAADIDASLAKFRMAWCTPLIHAAMIGQAEIIEEILRSWKAAPAPTITIISNIDVVPRWSGDGGPPGWSAFHHACAKNHIRCAELLMDAGCDTTLLDGEGRTGRQLAEEVGHTTLLERLFPVAYPSLCAGCSLPLSAERHRVFTRRTEAARYVSLPPPACLLRLHASPCRTAGGPSWPTADPPPPPPPPLH